MQISIRQIEQSDLSLIAKLANDRHIAEMTARLPYPYTITDAHTWFNYIQKTSREHVFAICVNKNLAGIIGLVHELEHRRAELGYWLGREFWGNGYASSAVEIMVGYAFSVLNVHKIYAQCFGVNNASQRVLEKNGFVLEGHQKQHFIRLGHIQDILSFALFKSND